MLVGEDFPLGLFHSKKIIVTVKNLYLYSNMKHKHLVMCFTLKEFELMPFDDC